MGGGWLGWFCVEEGSAPGWGVWLLHCLVVVGLLGVVFLLPFFWLRYEWNWGVVVEFRWLLLRGWLWTLVVSVGALLLSLPLGVLLAVVSRSRWVLLRALHRVVVELVRGSPLLVLVLVFYYVVGAVYGVENRFVVGVLTLGLFGGVYIGEIVRGGIEGVGVSQWESARAVGMGVGQIYRYVVFPQALRRCLPPLAGQFVSLIKDSSLLYVIGIGEFTKSAREVEALTYSAFEAYVPLAVGYLVLTLPIAWWTRWLEGRGRYEW